MGVNFFFAKGLTYLFIVTNTSSDDTPDLILDGITDTVLDNATVQAALIAAGGDILTDTEVVNFSVDYVIQGSDPSPLVNVVEVHYHPDGFPNDVWDDDDHELTIIYPDTACAAESVGVHRFIPVPGSWFTYVHYTRGSGVGSPVSYPIYADQIHQSGTLYIYEEGGILYVNYTLDGAESNGTNWYGISSYHLEVVDNFDDFDPIRSKGGEGSARPGQCEYSGNVGMVTATGYIETEDISGYADDEIHIFAHSIMWWY